VASVSLRQCGLTCEPQIVNGWVTAGLFRRLQRASPYTLRRPWSRSWPWSEESPQAPLSPPGLLPVVVHPPEWFHRRLVAGAPEIVTLSPAKAESERDGA